MAISPRILLAAGGTGGHIAPALALAEALEELDPSCHIGCVTGAKPFESSMYRAAGRDPLILGGQPVVVTSPVKLAKALIGGTSAFVRALGLLKREKPHVVVGMGGYVAAPVALAARMLRIPVYLHEQNATAGRSNRLLARLASHTSAAYLSALCELRSRRRTRIGNPLPRALYAVTRDEGLDLFGLEADRPVLLVVGGSQGARRLNELVFEAGKWMQGIFPAEVMPQILWATGDGEFARWQARLDAEPELARIFKPQPFIARMPAAYACADLAITRAGAGTLAELAALGVPSILVPYPHARDDHQTLNGRSFTDAGAAIMVQEANLKSEDLGSLIGRLLAQPRTLLRMSMRAQSLATPDAGHQMAEIVLHLAHGYRERFLPARREAAPDSARRMSLPAALGSNS